MWSYSSREYLQGQGTIKPPKQEQVLNWKAAAIGYGPGVLFGLAIGQVLFFVQTSVVLQVVLPLKLHLVC